MNLHSLSFEFSNAGYLIFFVVPFFILNYFLFQFRKKFNERFFSNDYFSSILRSPSYFYIKTIFFLFGWTLLCMAFMNPKGNPHYSSKEGITDESSFVGKQKPHQILFLIDTSTSMSAKDTRNGNSRLEYALEIVKDIVDNLSNENIAITAFTEKTTPLVPFTMDHLFIRLFLNQINYNEGDVPGTDLSVALNYAKKELSPFSDSTLKTVVFLTDGEDTKIAFSSSTEKQKRIEALVDILGKKPLHNFRLYTVGLGTLSGASIPDFLYVGEPVQTKLRQDNLEKISQKVKGIYYYANNYSPPVIGREIAGEISSRNIMILNNGFNSLSNQENENLAFDYYFQIPLLFSILCFLYYLLGPDVYKRPRLS